MEGNGISYDDAPASTTLPSYVLAPTSTSLAAKLVENGIARDVKQAHIFMLVGVLCLVLLATGLLYFSLNDSKARQNLERLQKDAKINQQQYVQTH